MSRRADALIAMTWVLPVVGRAEQNSIGMIERGQSKPTIETLEKIANALNIELKELVDVSKIDL